MILISCKKKIIVISFFIKIASKLRTVKEMWRYNGNRLSLECDRGYDVTTCDVKRERGKKNIQNLNYEING